MIRIRDFLYTVGSFRLHVPRFELVAGEYFVILGTTGSGKTAFIECLAGLRHPRSGAISIAGRDATELAPRHRGIGYVPQDFALFKHRTVKGNIAFGLENRRMNRADINRVVREKAELLGIEHLLERRIKGLSGGERQRVALARALAIKPEILILDEPVSALDEATRETVCAELRRLHRKVGLTTIHISHNLDEAFSVADRAAVMNAGRIEQVGSLDELLRRPLNTCVAAFMRCENILTGRADGPGSVANTTRVMVGGAPLVVPGAHDGEVSFVIRPENLKLSSGNPEADAPKESVFKGSVTRVEDRGAYARLNVAAFCPLVAHLAPDQVARLKIAANEPIVVTIPPAAIHVFPHGA